MIAENPSDPFWKHVGLVYSQYSGMMTLVTDRQTDRQTDCFIFLNLL